ncbi:MAG: shikimate kinase [Desulfobulbaceae bacterium]|nr:shikimate kinase [Desulfobulbaceae bacterium]
MFDPKHKIILTGYRATGKSSIGLMLAERLKLDFIDMDELIEARAGSSIHDMVAEKGWDYFRGLERDLLAELICRKNVVIATGGGAILHQSIWDQLRRTGLVVWLTADIDTICRRIENDAKSEGQRPSLTGDDILAEVASVLAERDPLYEKGSQLTIDTRDKDGAQIVTLIQNTLADEAFLNAIRDSLPKEPIYC